MASPSFAINAGTVDIKVSVTAAGAVQAILDSIDGVSTVAWAISRVDDTSVVGDYVLVESGSVNQQCDTTALTAGTAAVIRATINNRQDPSTGEDADTTVQEVKFFVPTAEGLEVGVSGEFDSSAAVPDRVSDATDGVLVLVNAVIRAGGGSLGDFKPSVRVATAAALPAYTAAGTGVGKTLTMNAAAVLIVDGTSMVLSDLVLVRSEGASQHNGVYKMTTEGTGGVAAVLTRDVNSDIDAEVTAGTMVVVEEGTVHSDQVFILVTNNPITLDTTGLVWNNWGVISPLVTSALRGTVNVLGAASTVLTTDGSAAGGTWAKLVDANVDAAAAVAGTKVAPNFGSQDIVTTGFISIGTTPADAGDWRSPISFSHLVRNAGDTANYGVYSFTGTTLSVGTTADGATAPATVQINATAGMELKLGATGYVVLGGNTVTVNRDLLLVDRASATKKVDFDLVGITAATTRVLSFPDNDLTLIDASHAILFAQTFG